MHYSSSVFSERQVDDLSVACLSEALAALHSTALSSEIMFKSADNLQLGEAKLKETTSETDATKRESVVNLRTTLSTASAKSGMVSLCLYFSRLQRKD